MKSDRLPDTDHISRMCHSKHVDEGDVQASAFMLRENDVGLSVNWLEMLQCANREEEIVEIRNVYYSTFHSIGARAKIAVLNVGNVRKHVWMETPDDRNLDVIHAPLNDDETDTHSEIHNMHPNQELIAELICETILEIYPARNK